MVSKWWIGADILRHIPSIENLRRIKSIDFFVESSRFNLNANTCDLSLLVGIEGGGAEGPPE
jgi:hypothetical protein